MAQGRAENFLLIVHCIIRCRTVCLTSAEQRPGLSSSAGTQAESIYKQFIRFFKMKWIDGFCMGIAWLIISMSGLRTEAFLVMDRTNWKLGGIDINVLFIGLLPKRLLRAHRLEATGKGNSRRKAQGADGAVPEGVATVQLLENQRGAGGSRGGWFHSWAWVLLRPARHQDSWARGGLHQENGGQDGRAHPQEAQADGLQAASRYWGTPTPM
ncbi:MAG: hypothetical protein IPN76_18430 [Saprospiraceae bacterium]|nr:hypothetical protein [Saprospiraceae bacterium]